MEQLPVVHILTEISGIPKVLSQLLALKDTIQMLQLEEIAQSVQAAASVVPLQLLVAQTLSSALKVL